ncbi:MAG: phosphate signaling complex protein PhoU [Bacillota bacterium]
MSRSAFQAQLEQMNRQLLEMSARVQKAIAGAVEALANRDLHAAQQVIQGDAEINAAYARVEAICLELLVLQQPVAIDARRITSVLKVITDLERMGDHSVSIAQAVIRMGGAPLIKPLVDIPAMAQLAQGMVADAVSAFVSGDKERALRMIAKDHEVDRLHRQVISHVQELMMADPGKVPQGVQLLFISHSLERIADHATNLGEWLIYVLTGQREELNQ